MTEYPKMYNYDIVSGVTIEELRTWIGEYWSDGWRPIGGVAVDNSRFYQAVIQVTRKNPTVEVDSVDELPDEIHNVWIGNN